MYEYTNSISPFCLLLPSIRSVFALHISHFSNFACSTNFWSYFLHALPFHSTRTICFCHVNVTSNRCILRCIFNAMEYSSWKRWNYESRINQVHTLHSLNVFLRCRWMQNEEGDVDVYLMGYSDCSCRHVIMSHNPKWLNVYFVAVCWKANSIAQNRSFLMSLVHFGEIVTAIYIRQANALHV